MCEQFSLLFEDHGKKRNPCGPLIRNCSPPFRLTLSKDISVTAGKQDSLPL